MGCCPCSSGVLHAASSSRHPTPCILHGMCPAPSSPPSSDDAFPSILCCFPSLPTIEANPLHYLHHLRDRFTLGDQLLDTNCNPLLLLLESLFRHVGRSVDESTTVKRADERYQTSLQGRPMMPIPAKITKNSHPMMQKKAINRIKTDTGIDRTSLFARAEAAASISASLRYDSSTIIPPFWETTDQRRVG